MRRFFLVLGIILMIFAFTVLTLFIILPSVVTIDDAPFLKSIIQAVACQPGEELTASYSTFSTPGTTTRSTDMSCVNSKRQERDISSQIIGAAAIGYLVPFLAGLFMTLWAGNQSKKARAARFSQGSNFTSSLQQEFVPAPNHVPLAQRLQELKDAYSAGLITEAEYTTKRKALLSED